MSITHPTYTCGEIIRDQVAQLAAMLADIEATGSWPVVSVFEPEEEPSLADWLDDFLDVRLAVDTRGRFFGATLTVTSGGPSIWIDVCDDGTATVHGAWGSDRERAGVYCPAVAAELAELAEEMGAA